MSAPRWRRYLRFWRDDVRLDVDDELRFHFDSRIEDLMAQGKSESEARVTAAAEFGDVAHVRAGLVAIDSRARTTRARASFITDLMSDVSYAVRTLRRTPGVALAILGTLSLGVGANAALYALLDTIFVRPPAGVVAPHEVRRLWETRNYADGMQYSEIMGYPQYRAVAEALGDRATATVYRVPEKMRIGSRESGRSAEVSFAPASYFSLLGVRPMLGRIYSGEEDLVSNAATVAVISEAYWRRALDGDSSVIGRAIEIQDRKYTIVGIAGGGFTGTELDAADVWLPLGAYGLSWRNVPQWWDNDRINGLFILMRPARGVADGELEQRLTPVLRHSGIGSAKDTTTEVTLGSVVAANGPGKQSQEVQIALRLAGVSLIVLLIACANIANLLLARGVQRRREIAVRLALGVDRSRLIRLLLTESLVIAAAAAAIAVVVAQVGGGMLRGLLMPNIHWAQSPVNWPVMLFALSTALVAGILAGLVPAVQSTKPDLTSALKSGGRSGSVDRSRIRSSLVALQAALSLMLLVGAALFVRSLSNVRGLDLGFDARRLVTVSVTIPGRSSSDTAVTRRMPELAQRLATIPGVERVALTSMRPMYGFSSISFYTARDSMGSHPRFFPTVTGVSPGYFAATGLRILRGSDFEALGAASPADVIVNEAMAKVLWPNGDAIGECIRFNARSSPCFKVRAVVENSRLGRLIEDAKPMCYFSLDHVPRESVADFKPYWIAVRVPSRGSEGLIASIRSTVRSEFPGGIPEIVRLSDYLEPQYRPWRLGATLFTMFGVLALLVAAIGIYSTVSYSVSQRLHEFSVRIALGAKLGDLLRLVVANGLRVVATGIAIGIVLSLLAGRLISAVLYGIKPTDPAVMVLVAVLLLVIAALASLIPAWRAARVDPVSALRAE